MNFCTMLKHLEEKAGKAFQGQTLTFLWKFVNYRQNKFYYIRPRTILGVGKVTKKTQGYLWKYGSSMKCFKEIAEK